MVIPQFRQQLRIIKSRVMQLDPVERIGVGLLVLSVAILIALGIILLGSKKTFTAGDQLFSIVLPREFINQLNKKNELVPKLLPELSPRNITLLVSNKDHSQIVYSYIVTTRHPYQAAQLPNLIDFIRNSLKNNPQTQNGIVELLDKNKQQIRFTATNQLNKLQFIESCLLTIKGTKLLTICSRIQDENNSQKAQKLISRIKINNEPEK